MPARIPASGGSARESLDVALAGRHQHAAGAEEQQLLNSMWLNARNSAAVIASAAASGMPLARNAKASPRLRKIMPTFSIVL